MTNSCLGLKLSPFGEILSTSRFWEMSSVFTPFVTIGLCLFSWPHPLWFLSYLFILWELHTCTQWFLIRAPQQLHVFKNYIICELEHGQHTRITPPKKTDSLPHSSHQPSIPPWLGEGTRLVRVTPLILLRCWLVWSGAGFIQETTAAVSIWEQRSSCQVHETRFLQSSPTSDSHNLPLVCCALSLEGRGCETDSHVWLSTP